MGCKNTGGSPAVRGSRVLLHNSYPDCGNGDGAGASHHFYPASVCNHAVSGRNPHVADHPVADSLLSVPVSENGDVSDASCAYGKLYCDWRYHVSEALVCAFSGSHHLTADVSCAGDSSQRAFGSGGADDLFSGDYGK